MLMRVTVPGGTLGLVNGSLPAGTTLEFERTASAAGRDSPSFVVSGDEAAAVVRSLRGQPRTDGVRILADDGDRTVLRLRWEQRAPALLRRVEENDGTVLSGDLWDDTWTLELRFPDQDDATGFYERYDGAGHRLTVHRMAPGGAGSPTADRLTPKQREALSRAVTGGYFEVPRRTTLGDIARELDVSDTAVSQRIRRGISNLLQSQDPVVASCATDETVHEG